MGRNTGNKPVIENLQNALEAFLKDHRQDAEEDPEWISGTKEATPEETANKPGCGCDECILAGQLLGRI